MKILLFDFTEKQLLKLKKMFPSIEFLIGSIYNKRKPTKKIIHNYLIESNAVIPFTRESTDWFFTSEFIDNYKNIEWVHLPGAGIEDCIVDNFSNANFVITNGKIIQGTQVADHAMALLLFLTRGLNIYSNSINLKSSQRPIELKNLHMLIIGFGGVGTAIYERARGFGMKISIVTDQFPPSQKNIEKMYFSNDLIEAIPTADVICMAAPLTERTYKLINQDVINQMKKGVYFINVSRGKTVSMDAIIHGLKNNYFSGVGLDVTDPEPLEKNHEIYRYSNVIVTPHIGGMSSPAYIERSLNLIINNIKRFSIDLPLLNIVDKEEGY